MDACNVAVEEVDAISGPHDDAREAPASRRLGRHLFEAPPPPLEPLAGESEAMRGLYDLVARVADTDASVLLTGESGTGKEVLARALHARSRRAGAPFVAVNATAMPETLFESELFGHAKGAFTDARYGRTGLFEQARGGTLFLDEIGDMPMSLQPKILRALQERRIRPVGSNVEVAIDVRIVSATNCDLEHAIREKRFREDLYFRLNVVHLAVPPLRARVCDVLSLAHRFLATFAGPERTVTGISARAAEALTTYAWPGNVRELQNCIERAVAVTAGPEIDVEDLPERVRKSRWAPAVMLSRELPELAPMDDVERWYVQRVLTAVGGNKVEAARVLGFDRRTLYRKIRRWETDGPRLG